MNHIFKKYLEARKIENIDFINEKELAGLLAFINDNLNKIKSFKDFSILASIEDDTQDLLARVVSLKDENNFSLHNSGYGVQFLSLICLTIFEKLLVSSKYKSTKGFFEDAEGKKYVPVLLGLDEPEIHLHPYMQRSLINYLISIVSNNDSGFLEVLSKIFSVDRFFGQIIISTHSPNILLSDYKQIIRFCKDKHGRILAKNGLELLLQPDLEKHLLKNMPYVKESFFSKCVILVEGDTELGAFPVFAQSMKINLDDFGISVIQAGSADSIPPLMKMLDQFNISNVGIMDADKYDNKFKDMQNLYHTDESDFEEEVVRNCFNLAKEDILRDLVKNNDVKGLSRTMSVKKLNSIIAKYHIDMEDLNADYDFTAAASDVRYILYLAWLEINKSIILGRTIGEILPAKFIPNKFKQIINAAVRISQNA